MENRTVRTAILSMTSGAGKTAFMKQLIEKNEITNIHTYDEEVVKNEIEDKDIVILLLNEESKEEIEECKKVAKLAKELNKFTITFVSDETAKEVQVELENEVEALITVPRTLKETADDLIQAIETFLRTVIEVGMIDIQLEDMRIVLNETKKVHLTTQKGNIEDVIASLSTNHILKNANDVVYHFTMGSELTVEHLDAISKELEKYAAKDANFMFGVRSDESLEKEGAVLTLIVA